MVSNIFSNSYLNSESTSESRAIRLDSWEEARGRLKEVDRDNNEIVLEVRKEFRIKLSPEKSKELEGSIGEKISILKTDGLVDDVFLANVEEDEEDV